MLVQEDRAHTHGEGGAIDSMSAVPDAPAVGESAVSASTLLRTRNLNPYNLTDWAGKPLNPLDPLLTRCRAALDRKEQRAEGSLPPLYIDPLSPLPLADAAEPAPAVHFVFFLMASRSYAHETINRNVHALQHPGALTTPGTNESNLFLIHVDAKMSSADRANLRANVRTGPDVYFIRRPRYVMWAGVSMTFALHDAMASLIARRLHFEYVINLSDADLTLRTDGELRSFFGRYRGRTIMSIVPKHRDPRRYKQHENFRRFCWVRSGSPLPQLLAPEWRGTGQGGRHPRGGDTFASQTVASRTSALIPTHPVSLLLTLRLPRVPCADRMRRGRRLGGRFSEGRVAQLVQGDR